MPMRIDYNKAVESVINAKPALRESVRQSHPELDKLASTSAAKQCAEYLGEDPESADKYLALSLMFILAVLANRDKCFQQEGLCLLGVRNVGVSESERGERRKMAALARRRPLYDVDWFVKRHLPRTLARIAGDLRALVEHQEALAEALESNGKTADMCHI